jgi:hypothetical protein
MSGRLELAGNETICTIFDALIASNQEQTLGRSEHLEL